MADKKYCYGGHLGDLADAYKRKFKDEYSTRIPYSDDEDLTFTLGKGQSGRGDPLDRLRRIAFLLSTGASEIEADVGLRELAADLRSQAEAAARYDACALRAAREDRDKALKAQAEAEKTLAGMTEAGIARIAEDEYGLRKERLAVREAAMGKSEGDMAAAVTRLAGREDAVKSMESESRGKAVLLQQRIDALRREVAELEDTRDRARLAIEADKRALTDCVTRLKQDIARVSGYIDQYGALEGMAAEIVNTQMLDYFSDTPPSA